ncbi:protein MICRORCHIDIA 2 isoform X1 [Cryptomeria japonica]|uniref:protein MICRORCHIDIA 2 isoform X1 n=1 Tax=Cryptomeria japonica TaxID=3369 RepID=UPI0025ACA646|nr:protein MICRORCHIDIA 2 isoform X1 [Cryptomeria japonica]
MPTSVTNVASSVIDLSSDDEEETQLQSSIGRPVSKNECSQNLCSTQIEQPICTQTVQDPALSRSTGHDFDWYFKDTKPDLENRIQRTLPSVSLANGQHEGGLEQNGLRQSNGITYPALGSPSHHERSAQQNFSGRDGHQILNQQGRQTLPSSLSRSNCLGQPVQEIQNENTRNIGNMPPVTSSMPNQSGKVSSKSSFHQFWKAGDYDVRYAQKKSIPGGMDHVRVHPKFLHSNATSHKWAFGAIAELLDNAIDEIHHGATYVKVDQIYNPRDCSHALLFQDDGGGMDPDCIRQCMSLGYSMKNTNTTIGQYGNGFKTSTMRLGADAIVFTRTARGSSSTQSIGLLSYTFLRKTEQDDIIVPMVDFELPMGPDTPRMLVRYATDIWTKNLATVLQWSPYATETELMKQFEDIGPHGTKVIIYNLWLNDDGILELDFDTDKEDIKLRGGSKLCNIKNSHWELLQSHISYRLSYSLRAYASILYLRMPSNFKIFLRGVLVEHHSIANDLKFSKVVTYKPQLGAGMKEVVVETTIGFTKEAPFVNVHGFNVYHKNRLIMPFWKVWQDNSSRGRGVIGVLEANFIEPAHDKQDFERTAVLLRLEAKLKQMTLDYWKANCGLVGYQYGSRARAENHQSDSRSVENAQPLASDNPQNDSSPIQNPRPLARISSGFSPQQINRPDLPVSTVSDSDFQTAANGKELQSMAGTSNSIVDTISQQNIHLFMRCETYRRKELEFNQKIRNLENELKNAKRKLVVLASNVDLHKKQRQAALREAQSC